MKEMAPASMALLAPFCTAVIVYDLRERRIPNRLVLSGMFLGAAIQSLRGWAGIKDSLSGMALGLVILLPFFAAGMLGGGDVKTLAAIGAITGPRILWFSFMAGAAAGGIVAVPALIPQFMRWIRSRKGTGNSCPIKGKPFTRHGNRSDRRGDRPSMDPGARSEAPEPSPGLPPLGVSATPRVIGVPGKRLCREEEDPSPRDVPVCRGSRSRGIPYAAVLASCALAVCLIISLHPSL